MGTEVIPKSEEAVPAESPSDIEQQIIRQIEYYFGNYNLSRDKFLREQIGVDDGWVPLETLIKFKRLKKLSEDFNVITEALKKSPKQLLEVSEDCKKIRRRDTTPVPENYSKQNEELDKRTLYVKGFKRNMTLDELLDFFKDYNVEHVYMRKIFNQNNRPFKGSVFASFETKDAAEKFIELKGIKYGGTELLKEWKVDYVKRKDEFYKNIKAEKEKKMLKRAGMMKEGKENGDEVPEIEIIPGCLLKLSNLDENTSRENIKGVFDPFGTVVFVDYSRGKPSAVLRFDSGIASSVFEKLTEEDGERKVEIGSCKAVVSLIEGDEEKEYWKNIAIFKAFCRRRFKENKGTGNKGRFKKWGKRQKEKRDVDDDDDNDEKEDNPEPPKKKVKVDNSENSTDESAGASASMEVSSEPPEVKKESSEVKKESSEVKKESSEVKKESSEVES